MVTYNVTLCPAPAATEQEINALLARVQSLAGAIPGLSRVKIDPAGLTHSQSCGYTMYFDTMANLQAYPSFPAYQAIRDELSRLSPKTIASAISVSAISLTPGNPSDGTDGTDGRA